MTRDYDLLCIGAGSGGVALTRRATLHGARAAAIEGSRVGGTCVIRGCVPKKLLMYAAQYGDAFAESAGYGWSLPGAPAFDMARWAAAKAAETARLEGVYRQMLADGHVRLLEGEATFVDPHTVEVAGQRVSSHHVVIAAGASPVRDSIPGIADCPTSDDLLDLTDLPREAVVIGAGYIACEFASMFARLGVRVTLLFRDRLPLRGFEEDLRTRAATALADAGIVLRAGEVTTRVARLGDGWRLSLLGGETIDTPWTLNATGRRPNTRQLGLEAAGVSVNARGAVEVDDHLRTAQPHIHAIGDVTDRKALTPVAIAEGRWLADHLFADGGAGPAPSLDTVASAVFTLPPIATVGLTEAQAVQRGLPAQVWESDFKPMRHAFTGRRERAYLKLIAAADTGTVIGLHMIGADAPEIVQSLSVALTAGVTKAQFDRTVAVHPTMAEEWVLMRSRPRDARAA
jgi:glutathione reductase (NADPH)